MPSTRDIRRRIKSVKNTAQITKAMQMVAASKMRRAQESALAGRSYADGLNRLLLNLKKRSEGLSHPLWNSPEDKRPAVLIVSTDKGLCGGLNTNLFREAAALPAETAFFSIGRKAKQYLARTKRDLTADFTISEKASFMECKQVSKFLIDQFLAGDITSISVLYSSFVNTLVQKPVKVPVVPMQNLSSLTVRLAGEKKAETEAADPEGAEIDYRYEPDAQTVLNELLPTYVHFQVYQMILEARASEHSARMVAMKSATDNAKQLVKDLSLEYNKARQAAITNEILEISSAQQAMS